MSEYPTSRKDIGIIQYKRYARNGRITSAGLETICRRGTNHIVAWRGKSWSAQVDTTNMTNGTSGTTTAFIWAGRVGYGVQKLRAVIMMMPPLASTGSTDPKAWLRVTDGFSGGSDVDGNEIHHTPVGSLTTGLDGLMYGISDVAVTENTNYRIQIMADDFARVASACVFEAGYRPPDDTYGGAVNDQVSSIGSRILDGNVANLHAEQLLLWNRNRSNFITWSSYEVGGGEPDFAPGANYVNIFDQSSTSVTSTTPGFYFDSDYRNTRGADEVNVTLAIKARRTSGINGCNFRLSDGTNNIDIGSISTDGWYTTTGTIPASADSKWDALVTDGDGGEALRVDSVCLWPED